MAEGINKVFLIGNLGQNPELRYTQSNQPVLSLRLATNERYKGRDGELKEMTEWHTVVVWGKRAEGLAKVVSKGTQLFIEGRLQTRQWKDKQEQTRYTTEVVARDIKFLGGGRGAPNDARSPADNGFHGGSYGGGGFDDGYSGPSNGPEPGDFSDDDIPF